MPRTRRGFSTGSFFLKVQYSENNAVITESQQEFLKKKSGQIDIDYFLGRIDSFELCWRRVFRVLWTARRSNLLVLKEINTECSLEGQILKLRLQYFGHLMRRLSGKDADVGKV